MIPVELEGRLPTDKDIPNWTPWSQQKWDDWQLKSERLVRVMAWMDKRGRKDWRNDLIDKYSSHWGALKPWLLALSGGKCWFSETKDLFSHYDVEHFRPKKEAKTIGSDKRDGYWWLAFDYTNFRVCGNVGNRKKGGWFPLKMGSSCSTYTNRCEESEEAYLLDPTDPDDVALIAFDEEGKVIPLANSSEWDRLRVNESVNRLKLNTHFELSEARRKTWQRMNGLLEKYSLATVRSSNGGNPGAKQKAVSAALEIRNMTKITEELSAVARWCVLVRNDPRLNRLIG